jgi:hypothetical protein
MFEDPPMTPEQRKAELEDIRHEPLLAQLRDDIRTEVARDLPNFSNQEKEFADLDSQNLLSIYMNWRHRQIHPHARTIVYSAELSQRIRTDDALYTPVKSEFKELTKMIATGEDLLTRNLLSSRIVRKPYELTPNYSKLQREEDLDLLLNEQGINHLHLPGLERKRGTPILFAIFEATHAFLLDLASHDDYQTYVSAIAALARIGDPRTDDFCCSMGYAASAGECTVAFAREFDGQPGHRPARRPPVGPNPGGRAWAGACPKRFNTNTQASARWPRRKPPPPKTTPRFVPLSSTLSMLSTVTVDTSDFPLTCFGVLERSKTAAGIRW